MAFINPPNKPLGRPIAIKKPPRVGGDTMGKR